MLEVGDADGAGCPVRGLTGKIQADAATLLKPVPSGWGEQAHRKSYNRNVNCRNRSRTNRRGKNELESAGNLLLTRSVHFPLVIRLVLAVYTRLGTDIC